MADEPCDACGEPSNTKTCQWCSIGKCRHCGISCGLLLKKSIDGGRSLKRWRDHMAWHREEPHSVSLELTIR